MQQNRGPIGSIVGGHIRFDDRPFNFDGVSSVAIGVEEKRIVYINIKYMRDGEVQVIDHGEEPQTVVEVGPFGQHYGYIKTVGGYYKPGTTQIPTGYISSLYFVTSKNTKSVIFGADTNDFDEQPFTFTGDGETPLVALHGRFGHELISIGAAFAMPS